ncbi:MAG: DUF6364 family protein [Candidatus Marinimicrobia bacterium]|nr:DUF6364 family protein [Candidatus Neomarinimicrobiota bacterium]
MNKKLTLSIEEDLIKEAKKYARYKNQSLSSLVQKYFAMLVSDDEALEVTDLSPTVKELSGILKLEEDIDVKEEYKKHIIKKYS